MAAPTAKAYANGLKHLVSDTIWTTDTIKATLHTSTYVPNQATDEFFSSATNELATANGYTAGGFTLASKSLTIAALLISLKAGAISWTASGTLTARWLVIRKDTGTAGTSPLLAYVLLDSAPADISVGSPTVLTITPDATNGVIQLTAT